MVLFFSFFVQYPSFSKYDIRFNFSFRQEKTRIKDTLILFYPIIISSFAVQLIGVTDRMISSGLEEGSVSALNYANKLMQLPLSVLLAPLITVLYPSIVESAINSMKKFIEIVLKGAKTIIYISIPFVIVMILCGQELIEVAFERGAFDRSATLLTVKIFVFYSLGLVFLALRDYLMNCLYALKRTKLAMFTSIFMVISYILLSVFLSQFLDASGIALATTIASLLQTLFLAFYIWKQAKPEKSIMKDLAVDIGKYLIVFIAVFICSKPFYSFVNTYPNLVTLVIMTIIVFILFLLFSFFLKIKETKVLQQLIVKR